MPIEFFFRLVVLIFAFLFHKGSMISRSLGVGETRDGQKPETVQFDKTRDGCVRDEPVTNPSLIPETDSCRFLVKYVRSERSY